MSLEKTNYSLYQETPYDKALIIKKDNFTGFYFTESSYSKMSTIGFVIETTVNPILKGGLIGATTGSITGSVVGLVTAGPPGALGGAIKGAAIGFGIGVVGGMIYLIIPKCAFSKWKIQHAQSEVKEIFLKLHENDEVLREFICPISLAPFDCPVRDKFGNLYEKKEIERWIDEKKDNTGCALDPKRNGMISKKDLKIDYFISAKQQKQYIKLLKNQTENEAIHPDVKTGLELAIKALEKNIAAYMERETVALLKKLRSGEFTTEQYSKKLAELSIALG